MVRHLAIALATVALACPSARGASRSAEWTAFARWLGGELSSKDATRRKEAVGTLARFDCADSARVAVILLGARDPAVATAAKEVLPSFKSKEAIAWLIAAFPGPICKRVRPAMLRCFRRMPSDDIDRLILATIPRMAEAELLAPAVDVLGEHRVKAGAPLIAPLLDDKHPFPVRLAAARALARIPTDSQVPDLIGQLKPGGGRIAIESWLALRSLTGEKMPLDPARWTRWMKDTRPGFRFDPRGFEDRNLVNRDLSAPAASYLYGLPIHGRKVIFIIDRSESMALGGAEPRIKGVKAELAQAITKLPDGTAFTVIAFSTRAIAWRRDLVEADDRSRATAARFVNKLIPAGNTDTQKVMQLAFDIARRHDCETVFLLTDGAPSLGGKFLPTAPVVEMIRLKNRSLRLRINTLGIFRKTPPAMASPAPGTPEEPPSEALRDFLKAIASDNDGAFVEL